MKFLACALVAVSATLVSAQSAADIPQCALPCFIDNVQKTSGCDLTDYSCQCQPDTQKKLTAVIGPCVLGACPQDEAIKTNDVSQGICKAAVGDTSSSSGGDSSMTASATMGGSPTPTFTSLGSIGVLGGGAQATGVTTSNSAISLNGGVADSATAAATMSAGPQVAYFTAGAVPAMPTGLAAAVGGLAGVVGVLAIQ